MRERNTPARGFIERHRVTLSVLGVAAVLFGVVVYLGGRDRAEVAQPSGDRAASGNEDSVWVRREPEDPMARGEVDAPVVMVEWVDLRCPFCALFSRQTLPEIQKRYVDSGLLRYEVRDVALFGDESLAAAVAARAAGEQGRFHEFLTAAYEGAPERKRADLPRERLLELAAEAGVADMARFEADLSRPDLRQAVEDATSAAGRVGVTVVPFFLIGDVAFSGAQPLATFESVIDAQLAKAGQG